ncbi:hypothetical protein R3P38DRAFT_1461041 [Favolaschia claudopus]|uniref:Uncharacterized protein n=1 Tax=Favolaschia claudopus TaxID=2862362 RepID=A0AAW0DR05_9AGAR
MRPLLFFLSLHGLSPQALALCLSQTRRSISVASLRKPNITLALSDIIQVTSAALNKAVNGARTINQFDGQTYEFVATLYSEMADFDRINNQTQYQDFLEQAFAQTQQERPNFSDSH